MVDFCWFIFFANKKHPMCDFLSLRFDTISHSAHNVHCPFKPRANVWKENTHKVSKVGDSFNMGVHFMEAI